MKISHPADPLIREFLFDLPDNLIARFPPERRDASRMLLIDRSSGRLQDLSIRDIVSFIRPGDLLVRNATKVSLRNVPMSRISQSGPPRSTGLVLFLETTPEGDWIVLYKGRKKMKSGDLLKPDVPFGDLQFTWRGRSEELHPEACEGLPGSVLRPSRSFEPESFFDHCGKAPVPPYFGREGEEIDRERYRTVYQKTGNTEKTSVAAPTAGFHFTEEIIQKVSDKGGIWADLELHIGYGTFAPLTEHHIKKKELHLETYRISSQTAELLNQTLQKQKNSVSGPPRIISIGTTALRALEDNFRRNSDSFRPGFYETRLFLHPPDRIRSVQGLLTNFHLPGSSLIMLTACMTEPEYIKSAYRHAIEQNYRFFSYGDCSLIL